MAAVAVLAALAGCGRRHKAPAVAAVPVAAAQPVSSPQITDRLPPAQPIPPGAVPPEQPAQSPPAAAPPVRPSPQPPRTAQRGRPAAATAEPAPAGAPENAPAVGEPPSAPGPAPQLRPMLSPAQERELRQSIGRSLAAAEQYLKQVGAPPSDKERYASAGRVRAFIAQAEQARRQGDLNRARSLAERAELLASDLARASK